MGANIMKINLWRLLHADVVLGCFGVFLFLGMLAVAALVLR